MKETVYIETSFVSLPHVCTPHELMGKWSYESETGPDI